MTAPRSSDPVTLTIDIGGTGIKMLRLDEAGAPLGARARELTPRPARPEPVLAVIGSMLAAQRPFARVSVGFPGVIVRGVVRTAPNLDDAAWRGVDAGAALRALVGTPVQVINDAELQGYGIISGRGVELVLTLGTGMGAGLYTDGRLVPNLELGHHPFHQGRSYEQYICDAERKRIGKRRFRKRVRRIIAVLEPIFNYDRLYIGGGNAKKLRAEGLPDNVELFTNVQGMRGGARLWRALPLAATAEGQSGVGAAQPNTTSMSST